MTAEPGEGQHTGRRRKRSRTRLVASVAAARPRT